MKPEIIERVPNYINQEEEQGMWQMHPSYLSITLNFFLLQILFNIHPWYLFQSLLSLLGSISSHVGYFFYNSFAN